MALQLKQTDADRLRRSIRLHGFGALTRSLTEDHHGKLRAEARSLGQAASTASQESGVKYRAQIAPLGRCARRLLRSAEVRRLLLSTFGRFYELSDQRSCLTCYEAGDFLGPHLDEPALECEVTVILYIDVTGSRQRRSRTGLELRVYGRDRTSLERPVLVLPTRAGEMIVGRGSRYWHERAVLEPGERVVALTACYHPRDAVA